VNSISFNAEGFPPTVQSNAFTDAYKHSTVFAMATNPSMTEVPPTDDNNALKGCGTNVRMPTSSEEHFYTSHKHITCTEHHRYGNVHTDFIVTNI